MDNWLELFDNGLKLLVGFCMVALAAILTLVYLDSHNTSRRLDVEREMYLVCLEQQKTTEINLYCRL